MYATVQTFLPIWARSSLNRIIAGTALLFRQVIVSLYLVPLASLTEVSLWTKECCCIMPVHRNKRVQAVCYVFAPMRWHRGALTSFFTQNCTPGTSCSRHWDIHVDHCDGAVFSVSMRRLSKRLCRMAGSADRLTFVGQLPSVSSWTV